MENVLVIRFSSLGDLVTLGPTFRALRYFHPDAHISLVTSSIGKQLFADSGYFNDIVTGKTDVNIITNTSVLKTKLKYQHFDYIYNLQSSSLSHLLTLRLRYQRIIHASSSVWQKLLGIKPKGKTPTELFLSAGCSVQKTDNYFSVRGNNIIKLSVQDNLREKYRSLLADKFGDKPVIALAPGASVRWKSKKWGDDRFASLAKYLEDNGMGVIVIGSDLENDAASIICKSAPASLDFTGNTSLGELKALLSCINIMIGNDSGPAHLAAGVGISTVTIFAPTGTVHCVAHLNYDGKHECLSPKDSHCRTCYDPDCAKSETCMSGITMNRVTTITRQLLTR